MNCIKRIFVWLTRFPYRRGYGVQSPSDYFLISQVIYERLPYYSYDTIDRWYKDKLFAPYTQPSRRVCRLLFRLANFYHPSCIVDCGAKMESGCCAMALACPKSEVLSLAGDEIGSKERDFQSILPGNVRFGQFRTLSPESIGILHLSSTASGIFSLFEQYYPYMEKNGVCIVENIHEEPGRREEWLALVADSRVRISFDLYELGILLLRPDRIKQDYIVNF